MYPILMSLYTENLSLSNRKPLDFPLRNYHQKEYDKLKEQLDGLLDNDGQELLDKLMESHDAEDTYTDAGAFISGFRLAALLMVEVFHDKDNLIHNKEQYLRHLIHRPYVGTPSPLGD